MEKEKPDQKSQVFFLFYGKNTWRLRGAWLYWKMSWEVFSLVYSQLVQKKWEKDFYTLPKKEMKKEIKVMLNGVEKVVEFKEIYTRKIDREFSNLLFGEGSVTGKDVSLAPANVQKANDYLIEAMTNLTPEEIDQLSVKDFDAIMKIVVSIKEVPLK